MYVPARFQWLLRLVVSGWRGLYLLLLLYLAQEVAWDRSCVPFFSQGFGFCCVRRARPRTTVLHPLPVCMMPTLQYSFVNYYQATALCTPCLSIAAHLCCFPFRANCRPVFCGKPTQILSIFVPHNGDFSTKRVQPLL